MRGWKWYWLYFTFISVMNVRVSPVTMAAYTSLNGIHQYWHDVNETCTMYMYIVTNAKCTLFHFTIHLETFYALPNIPKWTLNVKLNKFFSFRRFAHFIFLFEFFFFIALTLPEFRAVRYMLCSVHRLPSFRIFICYFCCHFFASQISSVFFYVSILYKRNTFTCSWAFIVALTNQKNV